MFHLFSKDISYIWRIDSQKYWGQEVNFERISEHFWKVLISIIQFYLTQLLYTLVKVLRIYCGTVTSAPLKLKVSLDLAKNRLRIELCANNSRLTCMKEINQIISNRQPKLNVITVPCVCVCVFESRRVVVMVKCRFLLIWHMTCTLRKKLILRNLISRPKSV